MENRNVAQLSALLPPSIAFQFAPGDMPTYHQVVDTRQQILDIVNGTDDRLLVVLGPPAGCKPQALTELAGQLSLCKPKLQKELLLVVLADAALQPEGSEAVQINRGLRQARELLLEINRLGLPTACEFSDTIMPQFFADLLSWACVSAGSETLRELVSGLSMPVGLRAMVDETPEALQAITFTGVAHSFLGVSGEGVCGIVQTSGNPDVHISLRALPSLVESAAKAEAALETACAQINRERPGAQLFFDACSLDGAGVTTLGQVLAARLSSGGRGVCGMSALGEAHALRPLLSSLAAAVAARRKSKGDAVALRTAAAAGDETNNLRVTGVRPLLPPACLREELPREEPHELVVQRGREELRRVLQGEARLVVIAGPPSIDDPAACLEFFARLATLATEVQQHVLLLARAPFIRHAASGWAGLVKDPAHDVSCAINRGLRQARVLLLEINRLGLPTACEFTDTITPQFFADRTTEGFL